MFAELIQKIDTHPNYGPAVKSAAISGDQLVLNYHTHGPDTGYCVSICAMREPIIKVLDTGELEELAHIRGFGKEEQQFLSLTGAFADALIEHYGIRERPLLYLNGQAPGAEGGSGETAAPG